MRKLLKITTLTISFLVCIHSLEAKSPLKLRGSLEWGYSPLLVQNELYSYFNGQGLRVTEGSGEYGFHYNGNAFVYAGAELELSKNIGIGLKVGYKGLCEGVRVFPLKAVFNAYTDNNFYVGVEAGVAADTGLSFDDKVKLLAVGGGYRVNLSKRTSLRVFTKLCAASFLPLPHDPYEGQIARERVIRSGKTCIGLETGIGIFF